MSGTACQLALRPPLGLPSHRPQRPVSAQRMPQRPAAATGRLPQSAAPWRPLSRRLPLQLPAARQLSQPPLHLKRDAERLCVLVLACLCKRPCGLCWCIRLAPMRPLLRSVAFSAEAWPALPLPSLPSSDVDAPKRPEVASALLLGSRVAGRDWLMKPACGGVIDAELAALSCGLWGSDRAAPLATPAHHHVEACELLFDFHSCARRTRPRCCRMHRSEAWG